MKHILLLIIAMIVFQSSFAQEEVKDYVVTNNGNLANEQDYITAVDAINWDQYRYVNFRRTIKFKKGFIIELLSSSELLGLGFEFDSSKAFNKPTTKQNQPVYVLRESGKVIKEHIYIDKRTNL